jgi:hypothetical protein
LHSLVGGSVSVARGYDRTQVLGDKILAILRQ